LQNKRNKLVMVASRGTSDSLHPALILAATSAMEGMEAHIYFTFGGMKLLTREQAGAISPSVDPGLSKDQLTVLLSKGGMPSLTDMLKQAKESGVKIHACSPTMGLFGMNREDLLGVVDDVPGASGFPDLATDPDAVTSFI
jgi:peroxiredoxin family protein